MSHVAPHIRRFVIERASNRCEYCGLAQEGQEATFHVDHVVPAIVGGETTSDNLALACVSCSLHKGARTVAIDPQTGEQVALFQPRLQRWADHFRWQGVSIAALSGTGRATVESLHLNRPIILAIRWEERIRGRHP